MNCFNKKYWKNWNPYSLKSGSSLFSVVNCCGIKIITSYSLKRWVDLNENECCTLITQQFDFLYIWEESLSLSLLYALVFKSCRTWWTLLFTTDIFSKYWDYFCMFIDEIPLKNFLLKLNYSTTFLHPVFFSWLYHQHWINHFKLLSIIILLEFEDIGMYHTCFINSWGPNYHKILSIGTGKSEQIMETLIILLSHLPFHQHLFVPLLQYNTELFHF